MFSFEKEEKKNEPTESPIDINYEKVKDWLIDRNFLSAKWLENIKKIRILQKQALEDMPDNEDIKKILNNELDYFKCKSILEILKKTEIETTSFLGFGGNKRLKTWTYIIKLYETENTYLAEVSSNIVQNVNFEMFHFYLIL
jgi:hypothetical protein